MKFNISISYINFILLIFCAVSDILLSGIRFFGANIRLFFVLLMALFSFISIQKASFFRIPLIRRWEYIIPVIFTQLFIIIVNTIYWSEEEQIIRKPLTTCSLALLVYLATLNLNTLQKVKQYFLAISLIISISSIFAILQFAIGGIFIDITQLLQKGTTIRSAGIMRYPGLSLGFVPFSYDVIAGVSITSGFIFNSKSLSKKITALWAILWIIFIMATLVNFTRSALLGTGIALFLTIIFLKRSVVFTLLTLVVGIAVFQWYASANPFVWNAIALEDNSAQSRIPRNISAINTILDHPWGQGGGYTDKKETYSFGSLFGISGTFWSNSFSPHNHLLTIGVAYGFIPMFLYIFLWTIFISTVWRLFRNPATSVFRAIAIVGFIFFIAYIINSSLHNYGPFSGDKSFWYIFAGLIAAANAQWKEQRLSTQRFITSMNEK